MSFFSHSIMHAFMDNFCHCITNKAAISFINSNIVSMSKTKNKLDLQIESTVLSCDNLKPCNGTEFSVKPREQTKQVEVFAKRDWLKIDFFG